MIRIGINRETCNGFANCVALAETIFDVDDQGLVVLLSEAVPDDQLTVVRQAAYDCPTDSISWSQRGAGGG